MQNLYEMNSRTKTEERGEDEAAQGWWMRNLYDINLRERGGETQDDEPTNFMQMIFATPRGGTAEGGAVGLTPRQGTTALGAAGAPASAGSANQPFNMSFATDWVTQVFQKPEEGQDDSETLDAQMSSAVNWLQANFGVATARGDHKSSQPSSVTAIKEAAQPFAFTPRGGSKSDAKANAEADDAVLAAAMQAVLATPRGTAAAGGVNDAPIAGAVNKMFKSKQVL